MAQEPTIRTDVPLVLLPVTVTDSKGNAINGLTADDFEVSDEGVRQKVRVDTADTLLAPVSIVFAVETAWISGPALAKIAKVGTMIRPVIAGQGGHVAVIAYDREIRVLTPFTTDSNEVENAFKRLTPRTPLAGVLLDAIAEGVKLLETRPENNRRILVVIGEARDRGSKLGLNAAIEAAQRASAIVYSATYSPQKTAWTAHPEDEPVPPMGPNGPNYAAGIGELFRLGKTDAADALARGTCGRKTSFAVLSGLENALTNLGAEIHSQYLLSFAPVAMSENRFRRVQVKVPKQRAVVRARPGYWPK